MPPPPRRTGPPPRKIIIPTGYAMFQPNPTFKDGAEIRAWLAINVPGASVVRTWCVDGGFACQVLAPVARAPRNQPKPGKK